MMAELLHTFTEQVNSCQVLIKLRSDVMFLFQYQECLIAHSLCGDGFNVIPTIPLRSRSSPDTPGGVVKR